MLSWLSFSVSDVLTFFSFRICYQNSDFMSAGPNAERPKSWHNKIVFYRWDKVLVFLFIWTKWFLVLCIHKVSWLYHTALKAVNRQQWCCLCSPAFLCIVVLLVAWPIANVTFSYLKVTLESRVTSQNARLVESKFFIKDCLTLSSLMSISHLFFSGPRVFRRLISSRHDSLPFSAFQTISEVWYLKAGQSPLTSQHHHLLLLYSNLLLILLLITNV